jgi:predicted RNA binding protein YcfA (HicA-like mRNA interferase family)
LDKKEALLAKVRTHKTNVSPKEIIDLLFAWGFYERKSSGDHRAFKHNQLPTRPQMIPFRKKTLPTMIVIQVLKAIQELQEKQDD